MSGSARRSDGKARGVSAFALVAAAGAFGATPRPVAAWVLTLAPGPKQLFLMVGVGTLNAVNPTINTVSLTVPAASVGTGLALAMTSDSTQLRSPLNNIVRCSPPGEVYVGGSYRQPNSTAGAATATLQVNTPATLTSGSDAIPMTQISWQSRAIASGFPGIPSATFNGGTLLLANIARNTFIEDCFAYTYANTALPAAGTYSARAVFTLAVP